MIKFDQILAAARAEGREALLETEGMALAHELGIEVPEFVVVRTASEVAVCRLPQGSKIVVKVVSPRILHKSDVGGVRVVANDRAAVAGAVREMEDRFKRLPDSDVRGFLVTEFIPHEAGPASECILGMRATEDFGPVVTFGAGGIYTEFLAKAFRPGSELAVFSPLQATDKEIRAGLERLAIFPLLVKGFRGAAPVVTEAELVAVVRRFLEFAARHVPGDVSEFEINPLVASPTRGRLVALDALVKLGQKAKAPALSSSARPVHKLKNLLEPRSAAVIGVSEKMNPGHVILNNLLQEGFDPSRLYVIKGGSDKIEGCRCVPDIASLPEPVDLLVLAVSAAQVPAIVTEVIEHQKAESLIVIPGGLEEKQGTDETVAKMRAALAQARTTPWRGPLINGGNCLGIRSAPGRYNTMFIPEVKLPVNRGKCSPVALLSQSGAFAIARKSKLPALEPKYMITLGNQSDVTVGDYLAYLADDSSIELFSVYVEGFRPGDGLKFLEAAKKIRASGRKVILYRAGRTSAGAAASASHTASIAGDYAVTRELCRNAGVIMAESLEDFEDLTRVAAAFRGRKIRGTRLGAISNAGFECVALADSLRVLMLTNFSVITKGAIAQVFERARISEIVDIHNPLDVTPMASDSAYEETVRAVLADEGVDVAVVGCVPLSPAINTLAAGQTGSAEDTARPDSLASRLGRLAEFKGKPWAAVVDSGALYDPMSLVLEKSGVPVFREVDRAVRIIEELIKVDLAH